MAASLPAASDGSAIAIGFPNTGNAGAGFMLVSNGSAHQVTASAPAAGIYSITATSRGWVGFGAAPVAAVPAATAGAYATGAFMMMEAGMSRDIALDGSTKVSFIGDGSAATLVGVPYA